MIPTRSNTPAGAIGVILVIFSASLSLGSTIQIAVASNFAPAARQIGTQFEAETGHRVVLVAGSTGKHYAQIRKGAPFDLFFAADSHRPALLEEEGFGVPGSRFTYAVGKLVLWSSKPDRPVAGAEALESQEFRYLAIANPKLAPYGQAARQVLVSLGIWEALQGRLVFGENVGQAFHFVSSGNAELGFVALSQLSRSSSAIQPGSHWRVEVDLYDPIEQQALLVVESSAAQSFVDFVKSARGRSLIESFGYRTPQ